MILYKLRAALPWCVSLALMAWVYLSTDIPALIQATRAANIALFIPIMGLVVLVLWFYDGFCYSQLLSRFTAPVSYREAMTLRGASYLLNVINYALANAVMAAFLRSTKGVPFFKGTSAILWQMLIDIYVLAAVATVGTFLYVPEHRVQLALIDGALAILMVGNILYWRRGWNFLLLGPFRKREIFSAFADAGLLDYGRMFLIRLPFASFFVVANALLLPCFGIHPPWIAVAAYSPLVSLITALPISIAGLGTYQMAMRQFFGTALGNPIPVIDAFATMQIFVSVVMRLILGTIVFRHLQTKMPVSKDLPK